MPVFDWASNQHCIAANDFSTILSSPTSTQFAPIVYEAVRPSSPASSTTSPRSSLKRSHTSSSSESESNPNQQPYKRAKKTTQPPTNPPPIRLRLTPPRPPPTSIKLQPRNPNPATKPEAPLNLLLRNPAAKPAPAISPGRKANKVWAFRLEGGEWCAATNNENKAQWLREVFACGNWVRGMQESAPTRFLRAAKRPYGGSWQRDVQSWETELTPEDALWEGGGFENALG
jgi:hypothetical protein